MKNNLQKHPLITEHKEAAATIDESLHELLISFIKTIHFIEFCKLPFNISSFLKHKLNLSIPRLHITSYAAGKKQMAAADIHNPELFYALKNWRDKICENSNLPIFYVASNHSIKEVCTFLPLSLQHLQLLSGFGKAKAEKYGEEIIEIVETYCNRHGLETNIEQKENTPKRVRKEPAEKKAGKIPTATVSLQYYKEGKTISEIAKERNLANSTIEGHLTQFIKTGELPVDAFADAAKVQTISELINKHPDKQHGELKAMLGDQFSFTEIRAVSNHLLWLQNRSGG